MFTPTDVIHIGVTVALTVAVVWMNKKLSNEINQKYRSEIYTSTYSIEILLNKISSYVSDIMNSDDERRLTYVYNLKEYIKMKRDIMQHYFDTITRNSTLLSKHDMESDEIQDICKNIRWMLYDYSDWFVSEVDIDEIRKKNKEFLEHLRYFVNGYDSFRRKFMPVQT